METWSIQTSLVLVPSDLCSGFEAGCVGAVASLATRTFVCRFVHQKYMFVPAETPENNSTLTADL